MYFNYPIFKSNLPGNKIGVMAIIVFLPIKGSFKMEMFFDENDEVVSIFKEKYFTNFDTIIDQIRAITKSIYILIVEKNKSILNILKNIKKILKKN